MSTSSHAKLLTPVSLYDASGNAINSTSNGLDVYITGGTLGSTPDKSAFTYGTTAVTTTAGVYQDTSPTLTAGTTGAFRMTAYRGIHSNLRDSSGNELLGSKTSALSVPVVIASDQAALPLPTGAATSALQTTGNTSLASIDTKTPALGQALAAGSVPVVLTASQLSTLTPLSTVAATQSGTWNITNVSGTVSLPTGASTSALQTTGNTSLSSIDTKTPALGQALAAGSVPVVLTASQLTTLTPLSTIAATQSGAWTVAATQSGSWTVTVNALTNSSVVKAQLQDNSGSAITLVNSALPVQETVSSTATLSNVASSASSVTLLSSNANRLGATIYNDSTQVCYVKFGTTASATSYTVQLASLAYYELPPAHVYTGRIDAIWASANGNARVTELTA